MIALTESQTSELADMFRLLGDATRLKIVLACSGAPVPVGEIALAVGASASLVSHHLRLLRAARLVRAERRGRHIYYALADEHVRCVLADMTSHVRESAPSIEAA
jgi:ArsR family transcriptional regulator